MTPEVKRVKIDFHKREPCSEKREDTLKEGHEDGSEMNLDPVPTPEQNQPALSLVKRKVRSTGFDCPPGYS